VIITKVEASGYQCLQEILQELGPYQILVGPNGSGKSVFLDVIAFLGDLVSGGLQKAVSARTENFYDLVWGRRDNSFRLAIEAGTVQYEMEAAVNVNNGQIAILAEQMNATDSSGKRLPSLVRRLKDGPHVPSTDSELRYSWNEDRSLLGTSAVFAQGNSLLPPALLLESMLSHGVKIVDLDSRLLRKPSPPGRGRSGVYDGSNLARLVAQIEESHGDAFRSWLDHVRTAIPDIAGIRIVDRPEGHRYLMVQYPGGVEVPQWMQSDGTLRLLALTILAYLPDFHGVYLIEEPEVGVHPTAIETIMQSLSSVYEGQVLVTSHSPLVLGLARPDQLLCFQKTEHGTTIVPGNEHPMLREWKAGVSVSDLFAAGVLG